MAFGSEVRVEIIEIVTEKDFMRFIETRLNQIYPHSRSNFAHILAWVYKLKTPPLTSITSALLKEIHADIENPKVKTLYNIHTESPYKILPKDAHSIVRLMTINTGICYSAELNCPKIYIDGEVKHLLNAKLSTRASSNQI